MVLDLPPGTGDVPLTICQQIPLDGAVIVSTPQELAMADTVRGVTMFNQLRVPIIGFVENMSYFLCNNCNTKHELFGSGSAESKAKRLGIPLLGELPLYSRLAQCTDEGKLLGITEPKSSEALAFEQICDAVMSRMEQSQTQDVKLVIE